MMRAEKVQNKDDVDEGRLLTCNCGPISVPPCVRTMSMTVFNLSPTSGSKQNIHRNATTSCVPRTVCKHVSNPYHAITEHFRYKFHVRLLSLPFRENLSDNFWWTRCCSYILCFADTVDVAFCMRSLSSRGQNYLTRYESHKV